MSKSLMQSPLHHFDLAKQAVKPDGRHGVWAGELPLAGYIALRGDSATPAFVEAASSALGVPLPVTPCTLAQSGAVKVAWISPDEWLVVCPREKLGATIAALERALEGIRSQVVDNSGGYTQVLLTGANASDVLAHCTVYDIAHLDPGKVVGTTFGKSATLLHRQDRGFCLIFRRSFADYLWRFMVRAATPYGFGVALREDASVAERETA